MTEPAPDRCRRYRRRVLEVSRQVSAAHVAPAFSCLEIVDALYHSVMRPQDIFIMSKGHGCLAQYAVLEDLRWEKERECGTCGGSGFSSSGTGYGDVCGDCGGQKFTGPRLLDPYCAPGGRLGAHPDWAPDLGIHASTGSLGHGLGIAAGQALAERMRGSGARVFVLLSDGECQEGSTWEAAQVAANLRLDNLCAVVDWNGWGGMDRMEEVHPALAPLTDKFRAFGWWCPAAHLVDGHDVSLDSDMISRLQYGSYEGMPRAVVCRTVKGRGVSFIEGGMPLWHYRSPTEEEFQLATVELAG